MIFIMIDIYSFFSIKVINICIGMQIMWNQIPAKDR